MIVEDAYTDEVHDRVDEVLAHYGIKGMRWGVRKETTRGSTPPSNRAPISKKVSNFGKGTKDAISKVSAKTVASAKAVKAKRDESKAKKAEERGNIERQVLAKPAETAVQKARRIEVGNLSDRDLNNLINRVRLEQQLADAIKEPPKRKSRGRKVAEDVLFATLEAQGKKVGNHVADLTLKKIIPGYDRAAAATKKKEEASKPATAGDIKSAIKDALTGLRDASKPVSDETPKETTTERPKYPQGQVPFTQTRPTKRPATSKSRDTTPEVIDYVDLRIKSRKRK